jgi:hypothetical protein
MKKDKPIPLQELEMRDFFAAFALMGMCANHNPLLLIRGNEVLPKWDMAYEAADMMMEAREK